MRVAVPLLLLIRIVEAGKNNDAYFDGIRDLRVTVLSKRARKNKWIEKVTSNGNHLYIKSKRKGDKGVAKDFMKRGYGAFAGNLVGGKQGWEFKDKFKPAKLNFFIEGHLQFKIEDYAVTCRYLRVGQGHIWTKNNWWLAGKENGAQEKQCVAEFENHGRPSSGLRCGCQCAPPGKSGSVNCQIRFKTTRKANRFAVSLDKSSINPVRVNALKNARLYDVAFPSLAHQQGFGAKFAVGGCVFAITVSLVGLVRRQLSKARDTSSYMPCDTSSDHTPPLLEDPLE